MKFNNVEITKESFNKALTYYKQLSIELIRQVESGELTVNNPTKYIEDKKANLVRLNNMTESSNFTILQRAYFEQTGECIALLK
jgi:hypothetical protein